MGQNGRPFVLAKKLLVAPDSATLESLKNDFVEGAKHPGLAALTTKISSNYTESCTVKFLSTIFYSLKIHSPALDDH